MVCNTPTCRLRFIYTCSLCGVDRDPRASGCNNKRNTRHLTKGKIMPYTRTTDPQTSHDAARSVSKLSETYSLIMGIMNKFGPMNDEKLITTWKASGLKQISESGLRSRRSELVAQGRLEDSGAREKMSSGRLSIVWRVTV